MINLKIVTHNLQAHFYQTPITSLSSFMGDNILDKLSVDIWKPFNHEVLVNVRRYLHPADSLGSWSIRWSFPEFTWFHVSNRHDMGSWLQQVRLWWRTNRQMHRNDVHLKSANSSSLIHITCWFDDGEHWNLSFFPDGHYNFIIFRMTTKSWHKIQTNEQQKKIELANRQFPFIMWTFSRSKINWFNKAPFRQWDLLWF